MARTTEHLLRSVPALADCSPRELRRMAALMDVVTLRSGATLTSEGEFENQAFLLVEGQVAVTVGEQIESLARIAGPDTVKLIREEPDATIWAIVKNWPTRFSADRARALGFVAEQSFDEIVRAHIEDELG